MIPKETQQKSDSKLHSFLQLADEVRSLINGIANEASQRLQTESQPISLRDRVLIGLALKMYSSFDCLVEDARRARLEAMHHLKTLAETFIYFHWVGQDTGETRAKLVFAEGIHRKIVFFEKNPGYADEAAYESWREGFHDIIQGLDAEWKDFKKRSLENLAHETGQNLTQWYNRIYRLACEPAHITDLVEYMPLPGKPLQLGETQISPLWAHIALYYGLYIILDLLRNVSDLYELSLDENIERLKTRLTAIRSQPMASH